MTMFNPTSLMFDSLFDTLPTGMLLYEESTGTLVRMNLKAKEILGLEANFDPQRITDLARQPHTNLQPLIDLLESNRTNVRREELALQLPVREEVSTIGYSLTRLDSPPGQADQSHFPNGGNHEGIKAFTFSDITLVIKDQVAMEKIRDELSQSRKLAAMGTMIAGVAHEMNNPLTGISMSASLLKMNLERLKKNPLLQAETSFIDSLDKALQEVSKVSRATEKAGALVSDLLSYSKPTHVEFTPLVLHELVLDTVSALKTQPHFLHFTIELPEPNPLLVLCDRVKIEQVFYNLVKNACDATEGQGILSISYQEFQDANGKPFIATLVRDNGPGIDKTDIAHIFDPFFTTKGHGGVGLGLSICYRTMEQHGGQLSVESVKGEGTVFNVTLPVYLEDQNEQRVFVS
jgi:signal transduction histidine kinase